MEIRDVLPRDAIPSVDDPSFRDTYEADPTDEVIVLETDAATRAYPVRYLHFHEIVNDVVPTASGERPVAVTWCPLCGSAVVYDRTVDGRVLEFGVSGKLADDDLVMYDRETDSEWKQSLGVAIAGPLEGTELTVLPAGMMTWESYVETHPEGTVLAPPGGDSEAASEDDDPAPVDYDEEPYRRYFEMDGFGLDAHRAGESRSWDREDLDPKDVVLGLEHGESAIGVPLPVVERHGGVLQLAIDGLDAIVFATPEGIHAFEDPGYAFEPAEEPGRYRADGTTWTGWTGRSTDGRTLERLPARRVFAFTWQDDHGPDAFLVDP